MASWLLVCVDVVDEWLDGLDGFSDDRTDRSEPVGLRDIVGVGQADDPDESGNKAGRMVSVRAESNEVEPCCSPSTIVSDCLLYVINGYDGVI